MTGEIKNLMTKKESKRFRIACCDDDPFIHQMVQYSLNKYFEVYCSGKGNEFINYCLNNPPFDLILLDINMPAPDGIEVLKQLKSKEQTREVPVVMFTVDGNIETVQRVKKYGASGYILKPLQPDALYRKVQSYVDEYSKSPAAKKTDGGGPTWKTEEDAKKMLKRKMTVDSKEAVILGPLLKTIKKFKTGFSRDETSFDAMKHFQEEILQISSSDAGAIFIREEMSDDLKIVRTHNIDEDTAAGTYKKFKTEIMQILSIKDKESYNLRDIKQNQWWQIYALKSPKNEILGLVFVKWEEKKKLTTFETYKIEILLNSFSFLLDGKQQAKIATNALIGISKGLAAALDAKDPYSQGHTERVTLYGMTIAAMAEKCLPEYFIPPVEMQLAGFLHDVGKIGVPDDVLKKPDRLSKEEYEIMKSHITIGRRMLSRIPELKIAMDGTLHHERYDGKGYPYQMAGEDIPLIARLLAVADTFDAMTTDRPYRRGLPAEAAIQEISDMSGTQFDPLVVELFVRSYTEGLLRGVMDMGDSRKVIDIPDEMEVSDEEYQACKKLFSNIDELKFGTPHRHELMTMLEDKEVTISDIAKHLELDPTVSAKILQMANSAFHGLVSQIRTIEQGVIVLGLREVKNMVYFFNMMELFRDTRLKSFDIRSFWEHSVNVGIISRYLAKPFKNNRLIQDTFLAGLMHDIGKLVMIAFYPDRYEKVMKNVFENKMTFRNAELAEFQICHANVGAYFCKKWHLPYFLESAIKYHHSSADESDTQQISRIVLCADDLSYRSTKAFVPDYPLVDINDESYRSLNINENNLPGVSKNVEEIVNKENEYLD